MKDNIVQCASTTLTTMGLCEVNGAVFRIKICGLTCLDDARCAIEAGADAIGLNFYPRSPRYLDEERAERLVRELPAGVIKVGVFVNAEPVDVCLTFDRFKLDLIQLHGDEPPSYLAELEGRPVMKAFRGAGPSGDAIGDYLALCLNNMARPRLVMLDAASTGGEFGGTGRIADWQRGAEYTAIRGRPPLILAGGLTPANIVEAIRTVRPQGVDTASGVESSPGRKDPDKLRAFVKVARETLDELA